MEFVQRSGTTSQPASIGILAGSFNPPTIAHRELLYAAGAHVDEVVCILPRVFPHKEYFGASLDQRIEMIRLAFAEVPCSIATSSQGLFIDIARQCRVHYGPSAKLYFLCGADAAERIIAWDYGEPDFASDMLKEFELLVAPRQAEYVPPERFRERVHPLSLSRKYRQISSTDVRDRIRLGQSCDGLIPDAILDQVRSIYK